MTTCDLIGNVLFCLLTLGCVGFMGWVLGRRQGDRIRERFERRSNRVTRAELIEVREPTDSQLLAVSEARINCENTWVDRHEAALVWRVMIDAILKDAPP